jgi:hypothetical protein
MPEMNAAVDCHADMRKLDGLKIRASDYSARID